MRSAGLESEWWRDVWGESQCQGRTLPVSCSSHAVVMSLVLITSGAGAGVTGTGHESVWTRSFPLWALSPGPVREEIHWKYKIDIYLLWCLHWRRRRQHKAQGHSNHQVTSAGQKLSVFVILGSRLSQVRCVREPGGKNLGKSFVCPISFDWILLTELSADDWHLISSVLAAACFVHSKFPTSCTRGRPPGDQGTAAGRSEGDAVTCIYRVI